jgi:uncharacterized membrane protein YgdD (TMEM256/DUF423 family)
MKAERVMGAAAALLALGMGVGALGSHALRAVLTPRQLESLDTAVDYQLLNALGVLLIGFMMRSNVVAGLRGIAQLMLIGIVCFSGGIYLMLAGAPSLLGLVTPIGGVLLIGAWALLAWRLLTATPS